MSIKLELCDLPAELPKWEFAYLLTGTESGRPHLLALRPRFDDEVLRFDAGGGSACRNAEARPQVTAVFPPHAAADGYSLVIDGDATVEGDVVVVRPTRALLHRPAP